MRERRALIAEALLFREPVTKREIPRLTPRLAEIYAISGPKTLTRDLNELVSLGLLEIVEGRYQADAEVLDEPASVDGAPGATESRVGEGHPCELGTKILCLG